MVNPPWRGPSGRPSIRCTQSETSSTGKLTRSPSPWPPASSARGGLASRPSIRNGDQCSGSTQTCSRPPDANGAAHFTPHRPPGKPVSEGLAAHARRASARVAWARRDAPRRASVSSGSAGSGGSATMAVPSPARHGEGAECWGRVAPTAGGSGTCSWQATSSAAAKSIASPTAGSR